MTDKSITGSAHVAGPGAAITARDAAVLAWLDNVGIADTDTMAAAYSHFGGTPMTKKILSRRLRILQDGGYIGGTVLARGTTRRVYWPGGAPYPVAKRVLMHDLTVAHLSIPLLIPGDPVDRRGNPAFLLHNRAVPQDLAGETRTWTKDMPVGKSDHVADGLLGLPHGPTVIVEIELAPKSAARLATIMTSHTRRLNDKADTAGHLLYLTTKRVGEAFAQAWRRNGHAADHGDRLQIIHAVDDTTLAIRPKWAVIPVPD